MIEFRKIELSDKEWITELLKKSNFKGCEYSFANNVAWQRLSDTKISRYKDFYLSASLDDGFFNLTYPAGDGNVKELFNTVSEYAIGQGKKLRLTGVNREKLDLLISLYGGENITFWADRDSFDYIYRSSDLINLSGKKYHGKRNHIARFKEKDWEFRPITENVIDDCFEFSANSYNLKNGYDDHSAVVEQYAINVFLTNFEYLGLSGGVLYREGKLVGLTIGERLNSDTFVVHIEKANADIQGAYPCLCNEFAKACAMDLKYINREEDMGLEGLRRSKESYHPDFLLEKYTVLINI